MRKLPTGSFSVFWKISAPEGFTDQETLRKKLANVWSWTVDVGLE